MNVEAFEAIDDLLAMLKEVSATLLKAEDEIDQEYGPRSTPLNPEDPNDAALLLARKVCDAS